VYLMENNNKRKNDLLGMPFGTANGILRKRIMFDLVCRLNLNVCFRCCNPISDIDDFSIEHKDSWQRAADPRRAFFDLDNISFSHFGCNVGAAVYEREKRHGIGRYQAGCRCDQCRSAKAREHQRRLGKAKSGD